MMTCVTRMSRVTSDTDIVRMCMLRCRGLNACTNGWFDLDVYWSVLPQGAIHSTVYGLALAVCNARCLSFFQCTQ